ncbi:hypothetical protein M409DRAFT_60940 [Zasmidium cellare ATCC 36951]|uniref:Uncharacterized protein n=1 Tax=Zasmidium cellare ATCC 36951 TaxID=1080233 RepID=A0A6A6BZN8_ZASCE|nr:uncharacterized protein M409DRAFT_60940 [Zasmidium cellare ATCC 36951]KAF2159360.1 hypothetical protein M409DRAFT_60940 [Zasmidium cellare ATCC 36951]
MTMSLPRPSAVGTRPAYLDNLFRDAPTTPSIHSSTSSISCASTASNYDLRSAYHASRPLTPAVEEDKSDSFSVRSKKSFLTPRRFKLGSILHRRTYPQSDDLEFSRPSTGRPTPQSEPSSPPPPPSSPPSANDSNASTPVPATGRRPSLPKIQTNFPPPRAISTYAKKPLPAVPGQQAPQPQPKPEVARPKLKRQQSSISGAELNCQRCYYYAARNCNGWVMGGEPGDPCEMCLQSGYFGAK